MFVVLPITAFIGICLVLINRSPQEDWRPQFLRAAILWGCYTILASELLSFVRGITKAGLALMWTIPVVVTVGWLWRRKVQGLPVRVPAPKVPSGRLDRTLLLGLTLILVITALVAWLAPPQTWDSLNYHLPRVAHWAQERAVRHFATGIDKQNSMSPGAEIAILHGYVLWGGDRLANFPAWFAALGSVVAASWIARQLGSGQTGQVLAAVVAGTIPMAIVQASSTMTDVIVGFWVICAVSETLQLLRKGPVAPSVIYSSLAAGLGLLTKPTAAVFLLPFAFLAGLILLRRVRLLQTAAWAGLAVGLVLLVNAGYLGRNYALYGNPISGDDRISLHANRLVNFQGLASNLLRNAALHTGVPQQAINHWVYDTVLKVHIKLGVDIQDPRTTLIGPYRPMTRLSTHEDLVGNLVHAVLMLLVVPMALFGWRRVGWPAIIYMVAVIAGFLLYSLVFKWQIFGSRLHLPFFMLFAPLIAVVLSELLRENSGWWFGLALLIGALPWLVGINSRPLVPLPDRAFVNSILVEPRETLLYANGQSLVRPHQAMFELIEAANCSTVGVAISGSGAEYPFWVRLGAPRDSLQIEWLVGGSPSARFNKPDFQPCAVICQKCPDEWETVRGLPKVYDDTIFRLYLTTGQ